MKNKLIILYVAVFSLLVIQSFAQERNPRYIYSEFIDVKGRMHRDSVPTLYTSDYGIYKVCDISIKKIFRKKFPSLRYYCITLEDMEGGTFNCFSPIIDSVGITRERDTKGLRYPEVFQLPVYEREDFSNARKIETGKYYEFETCGITPITWTFHLFDNDRNVKIVPKYAIMNANGLYCYPVEYRKRDIVYTRKGGDFMEIGDMILRDKELMSSLCSTARDATESFGRDSIPGKCLAVILNNAPHPEQPEFECFCLDRDYCLTIATDGVGIDFDIGHFDVGCMDAFLFVYYTPEDKALAYSLFEPKGTSSKYYFTHFDGVVKDPSHPSPHFKWLWRDVPGAIRTTIAITK